MSVLLAFVAITVVVLLGAILLRDLWTPRVDTGLGLVHRGAGRRRVALARAYSHWKARAATTK